MTINEILIKAVTNGASDIILTTGTPPIVRIDGQLRAISKQILNGTDIEKFARELATNQQIKTFYTEKELDISYQNLSAGRFRVNLFFQRENPAIVMRVINNYIPTIRELNLPDIINKLCAKRHGMILITGPTGSGKSTTLASMINEINHTRHEHIITIEDPIEYIYKHSKSIISQREVGRDTHSFEKALRSSLRENPDIILLGEMRDLETMYAATTAAETGHLLLSTLHTIGAIKTIDRIVSVFPSDKQHQIRIQLSEIIEAVISQQLIPKKDGTGRIAVYEVMIGTSAIKNLIRENKNNQIQNIIQTSRSQGMITMDESIIKAFNMGIITKENAIKYAIDITHMEERLKNNF